MNIKFNFILFLVSYRQAIIDSSFKVKFSDWLSGEFSMNSQTDMRKSLAVG